MSMITPCLWFDGEAEAAARFYVSLFPDARIERVMRSPAETPAGPAGQVLSVEFTLAGTRFVGLNGGPQFPFTEAVSFQSTAPTRPRSTTIGSPSPRAAAKGSAAGSRIAGGSPGRWCRGACPNCSATPTRHGPPVPCKRC